MNACQETQALLFDRADGRAAADVRSDVEVHLAACPQCRRTFAEWERALPRLRSLRPDDVSEVTLRRMENEIVRAAGVGRPRRRPRWTWLAAAAAVVVLAGAGWLALPRGAARPFARMQTLWGKVTLSGASMAEGAVIAPGGVVEIAGEGEAVFVVGRAAEVRLLGPGRVAMDGTATGPRLRLDSGRLAVAIGHRRADESFVVGTLDGRVEVRGTRFVVGYATAGSYVHVEEGVVAAFRQGATEPVAVKAGESLSLAAPPSPQAPPSPSPTVAPVPADLPVCPKAACDRTGMRARKAMRAGDAVRALELVDGALGATTKCTPAAACLDELGYLRAEGLRQTGRLDAAIAAYRTLSQTGAARATRQNALYAAAQLEHRLGRDGEARASFERAFAVHPDGALAEEALAAELELLDAASGQARARAELYLRRYPHGAAAERARRILSRASSAP